MKGGSRMKRWSQIRINAQGAAFFSVFFPFLSRQFGGFLFA